MLNVATMLPQGLQPWRRQFRWSSPCVHFFVLTVVTFGVLAPLTCQQLLHSYFYMRHWYLNSMSQEFLQQNQEDGLSALHYFERLQTPNSSEKVASEAFQPWLLITIITVQRRPEFHYVLQVASRFHRLLQECGPSCQHHRILLCNVEADPSSHQDAKLLAKSFPVVNRYGRRENSVLSLNRFEKEKQDYAYCLERSLQTYNPKYVLLVEDDAIPEEEIFPVLHHLLQMRFSKPHLQNALYVKLYHPERLQHYINPEPMRILEWLGIGMFLGSLLGFLYSWTSCRSALSWPIVLFFALYSMLLVELVGRHYFLELRRLAPPLYNIVPVTECCTPAMLFSAPSAHRVLGYLKELRCRPGFAKDTALYSLLRTMSERAFVVEPNLVRHVGMFSSIRLSDNPKLL
ncbi:post-GPI attachment to proteins factor 4 [Hemicordylus capensis]|uniref:post-GPI attachment to proteins factor 4 n=1 Tax=Hemicordylus capensis TaxID=884348 RepID=UPI0023037A13|nr:post-GPI attachment to proteins factor 4 [Hemicordylus capensis]XP_053159052.1 post-GPI attachment to proteins factor 4 [Hemicordylus capensis]XP_053159053.1 post-GPI attachment to proteins factor 4 [Hemicordylus capensis]XP_053159054.1 post-GPI attachment to proteins factor 4 [Hemicordylus capensis]XP_053159055.1 post-GPI attachment to proteins factor 4 [Hemicordylus capensis]XP_053159056.1 post-GPI attachment to proteins factor 4 [Hemicordylus capensis]XP_053159057.1 post-GPI attachment 